MARILPLSLFFASLLLSPWAAAVQTCSKQSPAHTVALLELYTSEGCSSCPPADRFVSSLRDQDVSAEQVVPLSLHVDYWDYIGWKDRFARPVFAERQRWLSRRSGKGPIYTPEIFLSGREQRAWRSGVAAAIHQRNAQQARAQISVTLSQPTDGSLPVEATVAAPAGSMLFVALYENGLSSEVKSGENGGVTLRHDYVVRDWIGPVALSDNAGGRVRLPRALQRPIGAAGKNLGVAAFVQATDGEVLQALALPLCEH